MRIMPVQGKLLYKGTKEMTWTELALYSFELDPNQPSVQDRSKLTIRLS